MSIINEPKLQSKKQRVADNALITIGLAVFSFFLLFLTLLLWGGAGTYVYIYLFSPEAVEGTVSLLIRLCIFAVVVFIVMLAWSKYNLNVFGSLNRRRIPVPPTLEDSGKLYDVEGEQVGLAQSFKTGTLHVIDEKRVICNYEGNCFMAKDPTCSKDERDKEK